MTTSPQEKQDEMDELLPWLASGALPPHEARRVTEAMRADPALERRYRLVREELAEAIVLNERIPPPPAHALDKLFAKIDAEPLRAPVERSERAPLLPRLLAWIGALPPRTLAAAALGGVCLFAVQAILIAGLWVSAGNGDYVVMDDKRSTGEGAFLFVKFTPTVSAADLAAFLRARNASIVDGPQQNGFFRVKVSDTPLSPDELDRVAANLKTNPPIVEFTLRAR